MEITPKYIVDENGKPVSVVISIDQFRDIIETYGLDFTKEEKEAILKGKAVRGLGQKAIDDEYISLDEI